MFWKHFENIQNLQASIQGKRKTLDKLQIDIFHWILLSLLQGCASKIAKEDRDSPKKNSKNTENRSQ